MTVWEVLGLAPTSDRIAIRRAYAGRLKTTHPEDDAAGFQALRAAYEHALQYADWLAMEAVEDAAETDTQADLPPAPAPAAPPAPEPDAEPVEWVGASELDELQAAVDRLRASLASEDDAAITARFEAILASPALDSVSVRDRVEHVVGAIILNGGPRAAVLIDPAMSAFGWNENTFQGHADISTAVAVRQADLRFIQLISQPGDIRRGAYLALATPLTGARRVRNLLTPGLRSRVRRLLQSIQASHPALEDELDRGALAWWVRNLRRPRFNGFCIWLTLVVPFFLAEPLTRAMPRLTLSAAYGICAAVMAAGLTLVVYGVAWPRAIWRERWMYSTPEVLKAGWAPLALAALFAVAAPGGLAAPGAEVLATIALVWAIITARPVREERVALFNGAAGALLHLPRWVWLALGLTPLGIFAGLASDDMGEVATLRVLGPMLLTGAAFVAGHETLIGAWGGLGARARMAALTMLGVVAALLPFGIWALTPGPRWAPLGVAAVLTVALLERVSASGMRQLALRYRAILIGGGVAYFIGGSYLSAVNQANLLLMAGALTILGIAAVGIVAVLRDERVQSRATAA